MGAEDKARANASEGASAPPHPELASFSWGAAGAGRFWMLGAGDGVAGTGVTEVTVGSPRRSTVAKLAAGEATAGAVAATGYTKDHNDVLSNDRTMTEQ